MPREEKVAILKESLAAIGRRIQEVLEVKEKNGEDVERWKRHLWAYVFTCFPTLPGFDRFLLYTGL